MKNKLGKHSEKDISSDNDDSSQILKSKKPKPVQQNQMDGAPNMCHKDNMTRLKHLIGQIKNDQLMTIPLVYNENIIKCFH